MSGPAHRRFAAQPDTARCQLLFPARRTARVIRTLRRLITCGFGMPVDLIAGRTLAGCPEPDGHRSLVSPQELGVGALVGADEDRIDAPSPFCAALVRAGLSGAAAAVPACRISSARWHSIASARSTTPLIRVDRSAERSCAPSDAATEMPGCLQAATVSALNSSLCVRCCRRPAISCSGIAFTCPPRVQVDMKAQPRRSNVLAVVTRREVTSKQIKYLARLVSNSGALDHCGAAPSARSLSKQLL